MTLDLGNFKTTERMFTYYDCLARSAELVEQNLLPDESLPSYGKTVQI
jgi:hypothetical protein